MRSISIVIAVVALLVTATLSHGQVDRSTGLPPTPVSRSDVARYPGATTVLWDVSHGILLDYDPGGRFSELVSDLGSAFQFTVTDQGLESVDLFQFAIVVICVGSAIDSPYTAGEVEAVATYSRGGGAVLVLADNPAAVPEHVNPVTEHFGITTGVDALLPLDLYVSTLASHPIFRGVDRLYMRAAGALQVTPPGTTIGQSDDGQSVIAAASNSATVVLGDMNIFDNNYVNEADNRQFALQLFQWLASVSQPVGAISGTWGSVKARFSR